MSRKRKSPPLENFELPIVLMARKENAPLPPEVIEILPTSDKSSEFNTDVNDLKSLILNCSTQHTISK